MSGVRTLHVLLVNQDITSSGECVGPQIDRVFLEVIDPQVRVLGKAVTGGAVLHRWPSPPHKPWITEACTDSVDVHVADSGAYQIVLTDAHGLRRSSPYMRFDDLERAGWTFVFCVNGENKCGWLPED